MTWTAPTLKDTLASSEGNPLARCGCGRVTNADMLVDVRLLPKDTRARLRITSDFLCDGCREHHFRMAHIAPVAFYAALGAPADALLRIKAFDARHRAPPTPAQ